VRCAVLVLVVAPLVGCVDAFKGSNVQLDLSPAMPVQASAFAAPLPGEIPANSHFTFYAFDEGTDSNGNPVGRLFSVQTFEIHHIVDLSSPCYIDVGGHVPYPGLHVSQFAKQVAADTGYAYNAASGIDLANPPPGATQQQMITAATAQQRMENVQALAGDMGIIVVTSASDKLYPDVAADCTDTTKIPPPTCTDSDSNKRRLAMCQAAWKADPNYFEGTDRVLTAPLNGVTHGFVDGTNPINMAPVGGAQFFPDDHLDGFTGYAIYQETDGAAASMPGQLLLFGTPTMPTRGVIHVHMIDAANPALVAEAAIFVDLDEDNTTF
jgi:hypothetical protein